MYINPNYTALIFITFLYMDSHIFTLLKCYYFLVVYSLTLFGPNSGICFNGNRVNCRVYLELYPIKMLFFSRKYNPGIPNKPNLPRFIKSQYAQLLEQVQSFKIYRTSF